MAQSMAEDLTSVRSKGRVVRFNDKKGFGFIKPDVGGEDLFVHHTKIKSEGSYRSLAEDDVVEFSVSLSDNKYQAINVTAPGGGPIQANNKRGERGDGSAKRGGGGGSWNRRNNGGGYSGGGAGAGAGAGGAGCYNCGSPGHIARDCNNRGGSDNNNGGCFKCGNTGHFARDCPRANNGSSGGSGACFSCGGFGHMARDCPGGGGACYNCGGFGHMARDCTSARGSGRFGGSGGAASGGCFNCGMEGHFARECPNNP